MTSFEAGLTHSAFDGVEPFRRPFVAIRAFFDAARQRSRVAAELDAYTDRQLADIGLSRADIPDVAAGRYRR